MQRQEDRDYEKAREILEDLFQGHITRIEKQPSGTSVDLRFTAETKSHVERYAVELKRNSFKYIEKNPNLPLLMTKYISMKSGVRDGEKLMMMFMSDDTYAIYDIGELEKKPLQDLDIRSWLIPLENYSTRVINERVPQPTIWMPLSDIKVSGHTKTTYNAPRKTGNAPLSPSNVFGGKL